MYEIFFHDATSWSWTLSYVYIVAVVVRLARFNVEQGGEAKRHFLGLPSPAAGMTLASWYPFSQTPLFQTLSGRPPWAQIMAMAMVLIGILMVSHVPYAKVPRIGLRTTKGRSSPRRGSGPCSSSPSPFPATTSSRPSFSTSCGVS